MGNKVEEFELDEAAVSAIAEKTKEAIMPTLNEVVKNGLDDLRTELDTPTTKNIKDKKENEGTDDVVAKGIRDGLYSEAMTKESAPMRFYKSAQALMNFDTTTLRQYNELSLALRLKAGYANETTAADGAVLVPDPEFDAQVYENLPKYGVAFANADVRTTTRNSVYALNLSTGLTMYNTAEAGAKTGGKITFSRDQVNLSKYAVIVPATDELTEDAAVDYWMLVTKELTRAYARATDEVVFTHATSGIINTSGVITEAVSGAGTTVTWQDLLSAEGNLEDDLDTSNHKWYMRKETWFRLCGLRADAVSSSDGAGPFLFQPNPNNPTTPWGTPVVFTRVLQKSIEVGDNDAFAVYGDLKNYILYNRQGLTMTVLREATVADADGTDINLAKQDATALRGVVRFLGILPAGNASKFVVLGTGTVS